MPTIQGELRAALGRITGETPLPQGSGRTDAGVHALAQVASFACALRFRRRTCIAHSTGLCPCRFASPKPRSRPAHFMPGIRRSPRLTSTESSAGLSARLPGSLCFRVPLAARAGRAPGCARLFDGEHDFQSFAASDPDRSHRNLAEEEEPGDRDLGERALTRGALRRRLEREPSGRFSPRRGTSADRGRRTSRLSRPRQRISASHGAQPRRNHGRCGPRPARSWKRFPASSRHAAGPQPAPRRRPAACSCIRWSIPRNLGT